MTHKIKVLHVPSPFFHKRCGGIEKMLYEILPFLIHEGFEVHICTILGNLWKDDAYLKSETIRESRYKNSYFVV